MAGKQIDTALEETLGQMVAWGQNLYMACDWQPELQVVVLLSMTSQWCPALMISYTIGPSRTGFVSEIELWEGRMLVQRPVVMPIPVPAHWSAKGRTVEATPVQRRVDLPDLPLYAARIASIPILAASESVSGKRTVQLYATIYPVIEKGDAHSMRLYAYPPPPHKGDQIQKATHHVKVPMALTKGRPELTQLASRLAPPAPATAHVQVEQAAAQFVHVKQEQAVAVGVAATSPRYHDVWHQEQEFTLTKEHAQVLGRKERRQLYQNQAGAPYVKWRGRYVPVHLV